MNNPESKMLTEQKQAYRLHFLRADIDQAILGIIIGSVSVTVLSYIDFLFYGINVTFYKLILIRFVFLISSLTIILILKKTKRIVVYDCTLFIWLISLTAVILVVDYFRPTNYVQNQMIHVLAVFCFYTIISSPLRLRIIPAIIITSWDVVELFFFKTDVPKPVLNVTLATFFIIHIMGILISIKMETYRRKQYLSQIHEQNLKKELEIMATTDSLTNLLNRRHFIKLLENEFDRYKRYGVRFAVMMVDFDHFKNINDHFGHLVGDEVLRQFGKIILDTKRQIDISGRLGGEEFGVLLPETTIEGAIAFAERIQQYCNDIHIQTDTGYPVVTVSIGVTEISPDDKSLEDILQRMDTALYTAKRNGRNRYEVI